MKFNKFLFISMFAFLLSGPFAYGTAPLIALPSDGVVEPLQTLKAEPLQTDMDRTDLIAVSPWMNAGFRSLAEVLIGRVPGVQVTGNNLDFRIRVRGARRPPLIVVDQQPFYGRDDAEVNELLQSIPVIDVASIEVIRNIGQAAIYGPGAGNGVILIRTRTGEEAVQ
jgi:hypothetical protein